jgi:hypothetical protein
MIVSQVVYMPVVVRCDHPRMSRILIRTNLASTPMLTKVGDTSPLTPRP